jgi:hypothetical protein
MLSPADRYRPGNRDPRASVFVLLRRARNFSFACPDTRRSAYEQRSWPEGRRAGDGKSVSRGRAFRQNLGQPLLRCLNSGIHAVASAGETEPTSCRLSLRGLSSPTYRRTGAPGKAAGHPGPHPSAAPEQSQGLSARQTLQTDVPSSFEDEGAAGVGFGSPHSTPGERCNNST